MIVILIADNTTETVLALAYGADPVKLPVLVDENTGKEIMRVGRLITKENIAMLKESLLCTEGIRADNEVVIAILTYVWSVIYEGSFSYPADTAQQPYV